MVIMVVKDGGRDGGDDQLGLSMVCAESEQLHAMGSVPPKSSMRVMQTMLQSRNHSNDRGFKGGLRRT